ncbi:MAG TPA: O-antigen ligase family protein [Symbiobacteriaceae bacterium]|nr:O-antigen ligase family protein [Symbiobacteriaceae bacterium]
MRTSRILRYCGVALTLAVLAVGPYLKGLFFWTELLVAIAAVSAGFGLWMVGRRMEGLSAGVPGGWAGGALLALLALYVLQFAWAVYPRGNLDWVLRVAAAWFTYVMVRAESGPGLRRWLGWVFVLSAAGVGVVGFLEFTGYLLKDPEITRMLSLVGAKDRMFTTFQYHNAASTYFLAATLATAGLALEDLKVWKLSVAGALMTFLQLAFFFTVSRGAVVVLPIGLLLLLAGLEGRRRWSALLLLAVAAAPMVVAMKSIGDFSAANNYVSAFKWIAAATAGGAAGATALAYFLRLRGRLQAALAGLGLAMVVAALLVIRPAEGLLPSQALRLLDINFKTVNVVLRLIYDEDALRMAADRPLGRGGWGWDRGYRQYQEFNYVARETHNHYAQTAVEAGWAGLAALLAALSAALWAAWRSRAEGGTLGWALAAGAGLIATHSAIEFSLSFGAIWLLVWILLAAATQPVAEPSARLERPALVAGGAAAIVVAVLAALLAVGSRLTDTATALAEAGQPEAARAAAQKAARFDRWGSEPLLVIGDLTSLEQAARLDPYHSGARFRLAIARELNKDLDGALSEAKAALAKHPMVNTYYSKVADLEGTLLNGALHDGRVDEARQRAADLVTLYTDFMARKAVADPKQALWTSVPKLAMSADFKLRAGQALFLTGDVAGAAPLLKDAAKVGLLGSEADLWLYVIYEKQGDKKAMAALETKPWIRFRNVNPIYKLIREW